MRIVSAGIMRFGLTRESSSRSPLKLTMQISTISALLSRPVVSVSKKTGLTVWNSRAFWIADLRDEYGMKLD
jgi:hypothetical protein